MESNFTYLWKSLIIITSVFISGFSTTLYASIEGGTISTTDDTTVCLSDEVDDIIEASVSGNSGGTIHRWIITDESDKILVSQTSSVFDFTNAPSGKCYIWRIQAKDFTKWPVPGIQRSEVAGWFAFSNSIEVIRKEICAEGGRIEGGPFAFCAGDGNDDFIAEGSIRLTDNSGMNSQWVITDDQGIILGLPPMPSVVNFEGAGDGTCLIWHLSYQDGLTGLVAGNNAMTDLVGDYDLSNNIPVAREGVDGGTLSGGPFSFVVDDEADHIPEGAITLTENSGANGQWVVTDDQGKILGLPPSPSAPDFNGAGVGVCLVWWISYGDGLIGLEMGNNALTDLDGCYDLSNSISVTRSNPISVGGTISGGPFAFCAGDGNDDFLSSGDVTLTGNSGMNSQWVITDDQGIILGLPPMPSAVNFEGAGSGTCLIWHLSYQDGLTGLMAGNNAMTDLVGDYDLSNNIPVAREGVAGGTLTGGPFSFVVDGEADHIPEGAITLTENSGANGQWVVTDDQGKILGLPPSPSAPDFNGAGVGVCLVWWISYGDGLTGLEMGNNALTDLDGCYDLSNSISVTRSNPASVGGMISGGPFAFCAGDGNDDFLSAGDVTLTGNSGMNSQWVITDDQGIILGLPPMPSAVNFEGAGDGTCLIWHLSYQDGLTGLMAGNNAMTDLVGDYDLSNNIPVVREGVAGGTLTGGPFEFTVDGVADNIPEGAVTVSGAAGGNQQWVVTDESGKILGLPGSPSGPNFDGAGAGVCYVYNLSYADGLTGLEVESNIDNLDGCYDFSNFITVTRTDGATADPANIVISEIDPVAGTVEIQNIGGETLDISDYWLCDRPAYDQLSNLNVECGDLNLAPGAFVTVKTSSISISADGDEMGLYATASFGSSSAIVHYVIWGDRSSNTRESVAVTANLWTSGERVNAISANKTINYTNDATTSGDMPADWAEGDATPCGASNFTGGGNQKLAVKTMGNIVSDQLRIQINTKDYQGPVQIDIVSLTGGLGSTERNEIQFDSQQYDLSIDHLAQGLYLVNVRTENRVATARFVKVMQ